MSYCEETIKKMLPKTYIRKHVAREIYVAMAYFKSLTPKMERYVYNDGAAKNLMSLSGTIPVKISDATYNIPICLWIEETYPQTAPICYVRPTRDMVVIRGRFVSSNGEVQLPYLAEWKMGEYDLLSLLQVMIGIFGDFPPVAMQSRPETEQTSCWLQFQRQPEVFPTADGSSYYLSLPSDDGQPFQMENETNC